MTNYISYEKLRTMTFLELQEAGFILYTKVRNNQIKEDYDTLIHKEGKKRLDAYAILAEKYYLSKSSIHYIICSKVSK